MKFVDLTGQVFGRLRVLEVAGKTKGGNYKWKCLCECSNVTKVAGGALKNGNQKSCGCGSQRWLKSNKGRIKTGTAFRRLLRTYKYSAAQRNLSWNLSDDEFQSLVTSPCFYTGRLPLSVVQTEYECFVYNGIDRLDSKKGYVTGNVVPCCKAVNYAKQALSYDEFLQLVGEIARWKRL